MKADTAQTEALAWAARQAETQALATDKSFPSHAVLSGYAKTLAALASLDAEEAPEVFTPRFGYWHHAYGPSGKRENGYSQHTIAYGANSFSFEGPDEAVLSMVKAVQILSATPSQEKK